MRFSNSDVQRHAVRLTWWRGGLVLSLLCGMTTASPAQAQSLEVLHTFRGAPDGEVPDGGLLDVGGTFYGTTSAGGTSNHCTGQPYSGCGSVFTISSARHEQVLYSFGGPPDDGFDPGNGKLVTDEQGNFYGTTVSGGTGTCKSAAGKVVGCGTVFKVTSSGAETILYSFKGGTTDGAYPSGGLVRDPAGNLYGATLEGGSDRSCLLSHYNGGCGTVFELTAADEESVLYSFKGGPADGSFPTAPLVRDSKGNLYGTTGFGGAGEGGTVFEVLASGAEKLRYSFSAFEPSNGYDPGPVVRDSAGNLYGTTVMGGDLSCALDGCGTVFELTGSTLSVLHAFAGGTTDGEISTGGLLMDANGDLYGTTEYGGAYQSGTVFKVELSSGTESLVWSFNGTTDGSDPTGTLTPDVDGNLYGTASTGGDLSCGGGKGCGTVFRVVP